ncbi:MAG: hypothetical protein JWM68_4111 [Verrucomicrobiales bacterium]|nr:hypothetical protein [Verrucomicrobiales bacterium]
MPQQLREVKLILLSGEEQLAVATGNNAAWLCICENKPVLIGRSEEPKSMSPGYRVDCPLCRRRYYVFSQAGKLVPVSEVKEVDEDSLFSVKNGNSYAKRPHRQKDAALMMITKLLGRRIISSAPSRRFSGRAWPVTAIARPFATTLASSSTF